MLGEETAEESADDTEAEGAIKEREKHSVVAPLLWVTAMELAQDGRAAFPLLM
jgi:hypothetical protein